MNLQSFFTEEIGAQKYIYACTLIKTENESMWCSQEFLSINILSLTFSLLPTLSPHFLLLLTIAQLTIVGIM